MKGAMIHAMMRWALAALLVGGLGSVHAQQQPYPNRLITIVVPTNLGTGVDIVGRVLAARLAERWSVPVVVENKVNALVGIAATARMAGDGYTVLMVPTAFALLPLLHKNVGYDMFKSFAPVTLMATAPLAIAVTANAPAATLKELVALAKAQPGKLTYASPGNGTPQHLAMELFKLEAAIDLLHVPYKNSGPAIKDLAGGHVNAMIVPVNTIAPLVRAAKVRVLAVLGSERSPLFPGAPALKEENFPGVNALVWMGLVVPAPTRPEIVAKLNGEANAILQLAEVRDLLTKQGLSAVGGRPERLADLVKSDFERWNRVIAKAKIKSD